MCPVILDKVVLGGVLHVVRYYAAVSAYTASRMVGCCIRVAVAYTALCVVGYYTIVTARAMSRTRLGTLLQFGFCI